MHNRRENVWVWSVLRIPLPKLKKGVTQVNFAKAELKMTTIIDLTHDDEDVMYIEVIDLSNDTESDTNMDDTLCDEEWFECPICMDDHIDPFFTTTMKCGHAICIECYDGLLNKTSGKSMAKCPFCRVVDHPNSH